MKYFHRIVNTLTNVRYPRKGGSYRFQYRLSDLLSHLLNNNIRLGG